jgi:Na+-transporting NADH:ubiquinone oxidoreductase subunit NqrD
MLFKTESGPDTVTLAVVVAASLRQVITQITENWIKQLLKVFLSLCSISTTNCCLTGKADGQTIAYQKVHFLTESILLIPAHQTGR